ncbi:unnamed protein product [Calypogeia fissa]
MIHPNPDPTLPDPTPHLALTLLSSSSSSSAVIPIGYTLLPHPFAHSFLGFSTEPNPRLRTPPDPSGAPTRNGTDLGQ